MYKINPLFPSAPVIEPPRYKFKPRSNIKNKDPDDLFKVEVFDDPSLREEMISSDFKMLIFIAFFFSLILLNS